MSDYLHTLRMHARLSILRVLEDAPQYTSNISMLATILPKAGINFTRDQIKTELIWLEEQGMIETQALMSDLVTATATVRGVEVAQGITRHPDIQRPKPGS